MVTTEKEGRAAPLGISQHAGHCCGLCTSQPGRAVDYSSPWGVCIAPSGTVRTSPQGRGFGQRTVSLQLEGMRAWLVLLIPLIVAKSSSFDKVMLVSPLPGPKEWRSLFLLIETSLYRDKLYTFLHQLCA